MWSALALTMGVMALGVCSGPALAAVDPATLSDRGLEIKQALKLDARALMAMRSGQTVDITFPVIGRKTVVFETTTKGLDGLSYWHGSLQGSPRDRVYLKQTAAGFVGAIRFGGRNLPFRQQPDGALVPVSAAAPISGQAYTLGAQLNKGVREVQGNLAALAQAEEGAELALPLPEGQVEVAIVTHRELDQDGFVQIQGVSRLDGAGAPTVITVSKDAVFGAVLSNGKEYQIVTRQGRTQIIDPDAAGWARLHGPDQALVGGGEGQGEPGMQAVGLGKAMQKLVQNAIQKTTQTTQKTTTPPTAATGVSADGSTLVPLPAGKVDTTITLFMTYGPSYVAQWGTEAVARTRLSNIVQLANAAYANSGTGVSFKIVGWAKVAQADTTPQVNLPAMRDDAGAFKGVAALRKAAGGAITVFFSPFNSATSASSTCGLAYVPGGGAGGMNLFNAQVGTSLFASLNDGQSNGYYCEMLSLAHELGHNLGNTHDKANSSFAGVFNYSYGKGVAGQFGTIMAYISPRVALFASPQLTCTSSGLACGSSTENVVATMLQTKATVAAMGNPNQANAGTDGTVFVVAGWLLNANGTPYTAGGATLKPTDARVTCSSGATGLYVCSVPSALASVSLSVAVAGKVAAPSLGSFTVDRSSNTPVVGTRFYLSDMPKTAGSIAQK